MGTSFWRSRLLLLLVVACCCSGFPDSLRGNRTSGDDDSTTNTTSTNTTSTITTTTTTTTIKNGSSTDNPMDDEPLAPGQYPYRENLDPNYELSWNFNSTHIIFEAHVKTNGYIGFGFSAHGAMFPSDVIIAWVKDGQVHFADRHATGHFLPAVDTHQDWTLVSGHEEADHTTITMLRPLDTCDDQDFPITHGTSRAIYSYSPTDPASDSSVPYHGATRGTKSLLLLDPPTSSDGADKSLPDDVITVDFLNKNYSVPGSDTTYSCTLWKLPSLDTKHHMIRYEPVIQPGHEHLVHHILVYACSYPLDAAVVGTQNVCYTNKPPGVDRNCQQIMLAWAIGGKTFNYPPHVGHSLGGSGDPVYFRMETHYDNPYMRTDFVDSSGIRMYLTKQVRQFDAGMLDAGVIVSRDQVIPPHAPAFLSRGYCHSDCISESLGDEEIHVFSGLLHSHLIGKAITSRIVRDGVELPPLLEDKSYDFDYQEMRLLGQERTIKKGDVLVTDCIYDSSKRSTVTFGGLSSRQEMCLSLLLYYPKSNLSGCLSKSIYNSAPPGYAATIQDMDWSTQAARDDLAKTIADSDIINYCGGAKTPQTRVHVTRQPNITVPFKPETKCQD